MAEMAQTSLRMVPGRKQTRLEELAVALGVPIHLLIPQEERPPPQLPRRGSHPYPSGQNISRTESGHSALSTGSGKQSLDAHEATLALETVVRNKGSRSDLESLLNVGANVNILPRKIKKLNKFRPKSRQEDVRCNVLQLAVQEQCYDFLHLLASKADQQSLDEALSFAIRNGDYACIDLLLQHGAEPSNHRAAFCQAVRDGDEKLVQALTSGFKKLSPCIASECMEQAVKSGNLNIVSMLIGCGANVYANVRSAREEAVMLRSCLAEAVMLRRPDIMVALCLFGGLLLPKGLAQLLSSHCRRYPRQDKNSLLVVEVLLAAGAGGRLLGEQLLQATMNDEYDLASLLVMYGASTWCYSLATFNTAMAKGDARMFSILMETKLQPLHLDILLAQTFEMPPTVARETRFGMLQAVLVKGPSQRSLNAALVQAVRLADLESANLLVDHGASSDYDGGRAVSQTVLSNSKDLLRIVLRGNQTQEVLTSGLAALRGKAFTDQLQLCKLLLEAGARGIMLNESLLHAVSSSHVYDARYQLVDMLVEAGADVNYGSGECFREAAWRGDVRCLEILVRGKPSQENLSACIATAKMIPSEITRFAFVEILLAAGASGNPVHKALLDSISDSPGSTEYVRILLQLGQADVNFRNGEAVRRATELQSTAILSLLLDNSPTTATVDRSLLHVSRTKGDINVLELVLNAGPTDSCVSNLLITAIQDGIKSSSIDLPLIHILLQHNASVDYRDGKSLQLALFEIELFDLLLSKLSRPETLQSLLVYILEHEAQPNATDLSLKALAVAKNFSNARRQVFVRQAESVLLPQLMYSSPVSPLLRHLLESGLSVNSNNGKLFQIAVGTGNLELFGLLLEFGPKHESLELCFPIAWELQGPVRNMILTMILDATDEAPLSNIEMWLTRALREAQPSAELIQLLLTHKSFLPSVSEELVNEALLLVIELFETYEAPLLLVEMLIARQANVNWRGGLPMLKAASTGNKTLICKLLATVPSETTLLKSLPFLIASGQSEVSIASLLDEFFVCQPRLNLNSTYHRPVSLLSLCLEKIPNSRLLFQKLVTYGADVNQEKDVYLDTKTSEKVNLLLWILLHYPPDDSAAIIELLVSHGADVDFVTAITKRTPLLVAAKQSSSATVKLLLKHSTNASARDFGSCSPLYYATSRRALDVMKALIEYGADCDDGSIQEAARNCDMEAVELLLRHGHDPNYASLLHYGRSALEELVLHCECRSYRNTQLKAVISSLITGGSNIRFCKNSKSFLLLALDNPNHAPELTSALLGAGLKDWINDDSNLYHDDQGLAYSPLSYVLKDLQASEPTHKDRLIQILRNYGCAERFYRVSGAQPPDYVGAPQQVVAAEEARRARQQRLEETEEEHRIELRRRREAAREAQKLEQQLHEMRLAHQKATEGALAAVKRKIMKEEKQLLDKQQKVAQSLIGRMRQNQLAWYYEEEPD